MSRDFGASLATEFPWLEESKKNQLVRYFKLLLKWNEKINLISKASVGEAERLHFFDCIMATRIIEPYLEEGRDVWDFGGGNGFPGAILSIMRPDLRVTTVDSDERKIAFLSTLKVEIGLKQLTVKTCRVEEIDARSVSLGVTRGFRPVSEAHRLLAPCFVPGGHLFHLKGKNWSEELEEEVQWSTSVLAEYDLPPQRVVLHSVRA